MKTVLIILSILLASTAYAATDVTFQWDANTESDLAGYRLYRAETSGAYTKGAFIKEIPCAASQTACATATDQGVPDGTYFWVVTAFDTSGFESDWSNEVTDTIDTQAPSPPGHLNIFQKIVGWFRKALGLG